MQSSPFDRFRGGTFAVLGCSWFHLGQVSHHRTGAGMLQEWLAISKNTSRLKWFTPKLVCGCTAVPVCLVLVNRQIYVMRGWDFFQHWSQNIHLHTGTLLHFSVCICLLLFKTKATINWDSWVCFIYFLIVPSGILFMTMLFLAKIRKFVVF